ncbi:MAG: response regulator [Verrucomicrobiales bacterium]
MPAKSKSRTSRGQHRLFIVDDHPIFREGLSKIVSQETDLQVCGEADTADEAFAKITALKPDLVLTDIGLAGKSGLELIQDLQAVSPDLPVLVISMHDESVYAERVLRAGGRGYVMKQAGPAMMMQAIRHVLEGKVAVSDSISAAVLESLVRPGAARAGAPMVAKLSNREFEVLRLIGQGKDSHDIAASLHLSIKTVDTHRGNIKAKLGLRTSTELIHYAVRWLAGQA